MPVAASASASAGRFFLDVDGQPVGLLKRWGGLAMEADIASQWVGTERLPKKQVTAVRCTPGHVSVGLAMGKALQDWVRNSMEGNPSLHDGALVMADFNYRAASSTTFTGALITEITVPRLDGSSKDAGYIDITFDAERTNWEKGDGRDLRNRVGGPVKPWQTSNFSVNIGDLPCARVTSIDAFTWRCAVAGTGVGATRLTTRSAGQMTVPDLRLTVSAADYPKWLEAAKAWFVEGKRLEAHEMSGRINLLGPNMKDELAWIDLRNVGFRRFSSMEGDALSDQAARFTVDLYVEKMVLQVRAPGT